MIHFKKYTSLRIKKKLQLINLLICSAFLLIILIVSLAFVNIDKLAIDNTKRDIDRLLSSSQILSQLTEIFSDIDLVANTFYGKDTYLQITSYGLKNSVSNIASKTDSLSLKKALTSLNLDLDAFFLQCTGINKLMQSIQTLDIETLEAFTNFEYLISDLLLESTFTKENTDYIEQLLVLVVGFRESFLTIGKQYHEIEGKNHLILKNDNPADLLITIDDLLLRLQTIYASRPDIARHGKNIARLIEKYRENILKYHNASVKLGNLTKDLYQSKHLSIEALKKIEEEVTNSNKFISRHIERIITLTGVTVILLSFLVVVVLLLSTSFLFRKSINSPMKEILSGIKSFLDDNLKSRIYLGRSDEWADIEKGLNNMADNLYETYNLLKNRELELKKNELFLASILENIPNMIFVKDADELKFVKLNKAGEELLGYPKESFIGKNDFDFFPEDEARFFIEKDRKVLNDKKLLVIPQEKIRTRNKGERLLRTKKIPILGDNGQPQFLVGISEDITDIKTLEKELVHNEKLAAIGGLSASIAHEFNNPLQGVMNVIKGIRKRASLDEEDSDLVDQALKECVRMKDLIRNLQDFYRPSTGRVLIMDIHKIIDALLLLTKKECESKGVTIETNFAKSLPKIAAISDQIKQVLLNIINNALYACKQKATITITTEAVAKDRIAIRIQDTGEGINPVDIEKIFDPFFSTKPDNKGTGLGLSVSYGIIKKHRGRIDVTSEPGKGSTFTITLPVKGIENA